MLTLLYSVHVGAMGMGCSHTENSKMIQPAVSFVRIGPASTKELNGPGPFHGLIVWPGPDQYLLDLLEVILKRSGRVQGVCTHGLSR